MSVSTVNEVHTNPRVNALKKRHTELSKQVEDARKHPSTTDLYLSKLKKQKLVIKEKIYQEERQTASA